MALTEIPKELSSTPSIVDGGNATAITINADESVALANKLSIGTDSGDAFNPSSMIRVQTSGGGYVQIKTSTTDQAGFLVGDTDDDFAGGMIYNNNTDSLSFNANNAERMRILPTGGITFNGDTAQADALYDYEEGSFTTVGSRINASGYTPSMQYTKVGSMVNITARIVWTGTDNSNNPLQFTLPFSVENVAASSTGAVFYSGTQINSGNPLCAYAGSGSSNVYFYGTAGGAFDQIKVNEVNGSYTMLFSFTYKTTQ